MIINTTLEPDMHTLKFDVVIPEWAKWVAQDSDGEWYCFHYKPTINRVLSAWIAGSEYETESLCYGFANPNWRDTLTMIDREK